MCGSGVAEFLSALLTPLIAIIATYIAWQQWKTDSNKFKFERYERRLRIYEEVRRILSVVVRDADARYGELLRFRTTVSEADFLFGPEISEYIDEIYRRGISLHSANQQYRDFTQPTPPGYDHQKIVDQTHTALNWLTSQFEPAKEKFAPYLNVSK